jgi:hypothetical protein
MAPDLLSTICREIDERLNELRPLLAEQERLLVAADALLATGGENLTLAAKVSPSGGGPGRDRAGAGRGGSAASAIKHVAAGQTGAEAESKVDEVSTTPLEATEIQPAKRSRRSATKPKPERAARGVAREAILGALEHGSHTVGELVVVTAMSGPNINGNLRRLVAEGAVVKAKREGKAAWALADSAR